MRYKSAVRPIEEGNKQLNGDFFKHFESEIVSYLGLTLSACV